MSLKRKLKDFEQDLSDEDDIQEDSSEDKELSDHVSERSQDSDTEQEISSNEEAEIQSDLDPLSSVYTGRDGKTKWSSEPYKKDHTKPEYFVDTSGVKLTARNAKTEKDCWKLFFNDNILEQILRHTNAKIRTRQQTKKTGTCLKDTTIDELLALFGLMYLAGLNGANRRGLKELWQTDGTGIEIFRLTMSMQRFYFLQSSLRFEDDDDKSKIVDNLAPIRFVLNEFITNCQNAYNPGAYLTIDEKLIPFRGKCSFRQCMQNRSAKYGIKAYTLVDAKNYNTVNIEIYLGNQPAGPFQQSNKPFDIVDRLVQPVSKSYRNVSFDNWFTSVSLVTHLWRDHKLTSTGALRRDQEEIPSSFIRKRGLEVNKSLFAFNKDVTLVSYRPRNFKIVLVLSSLHHDTCIDPASGEKRKPEVITFYESTRSAVNVAEELCATYDVSRNSRRWPLTIFYSLMNIAALNSVTIYRENNESDIHRRDFIRKLALAMLEGHLCMRGNLENLPKEIRKRIREQRGETVTYSPPPPTGSKRQKRCRDCPSTKDRKTKYACNVCNKPICLSHVIALCEHCVGADSD